MRLLALESPQAGMPTLPGAALNRNLSWKVGAPCVSTLRGLWKEILWLWGHVSLPSNHSSRLSSDLWSQPTQRVSLDPSPASSFLVGESKLSLSTQVWSRTLLPFLLGRTATTASSLVGLDRGFSTGWGSGVKSLSPGLSDVPGLCSSGAWPANVHSCLCQVH